MLVHVDWDTSTDDRDEPYSLAEVGLKETVKVPNEIEEDLISDWLSDEYGWCHFGWYQVD